MATLTLYGIPLFGTLFVPLLIGVVTIFLLWIFVLSNKRLQETSPSEKSEEQNTSDEVPDFQTDQNKVKSKDRKKKSCRSGGGCNSSCSNNKNGKSSGCCSDSQAIETVKVFIDKSSSICQEYASVLTDQFTLGSITSTTIGSSDSDFMDLSKHADGSLCIFLIETASVNGHQHWLHRVLSNYDSMERPLTKMKYSIFMFNPVPIDNCPVEAIDQLLHKSGAVRVCKAESSLISSALSSTCFDDWAEELFSQVEKWNAPKRKACKCGPKKKDQIDESCGSSKCSDSETEDGRLKTTAQAILDVEDIAKLL